MQNGNVQAEFATNYIADSDLSAVPESHLGTSSYGKAEVDFFLEC